jgi:CubicO group peptidase (beta-lactamase class C family)
MDDRRARIAARAEAHVAAGAFSGIEWRVERGGKLFSEGRAGLADALAGRPMADVPIYRIYSMTKPIIAAVVMMLVEEGRLRLYDPVAAFLPEFAAPEVLLPGGDTRRAAGPIAVWHLLTHMSGLSYGFLPGCPVGERYARAGLSRQRLSLAGLVAALAAEPLAFDPGTGWRYSFGNDVAGRLIEVIEGRPLGAVLKARLFDPLGLEDTAFFVPEAQRHRMMGIFGQGDLDRLLDFAPPPQRLIPAEVEASAPHDDPDFARGGHGLFSTLPDYMKVARFLSDGRAADGRPLLSRHGRAALWVNRIPDAMLPLRIGPFEQWGYGFGLAGRVMLDTGRMPSLSSVGECGWAGAASTHFWIDPAEDLIGVIMAQQLASIVPLADDLRIAVYQALD